MLRLQIITLYVAQRTRTALQLSARQGLMHTWSVRLGARRVSSCNPSSESSFAQSFSSCSLQLTRRVGAALAVDLPLAGDWSQPLRPGLGTRAFSPKCRVTRIEAGWCAPWSDPFPHLKKSVIAIMVWSKAIPSGEPWNHEV